MSQILELNVYSSQPRGVGFSCYKRNKSGPYRKARMKDYLKCGLSMGSPSPREIY
jgi:hypothetical protein